MRIALLPVVVGLGASGLWACDERREPGPEAPVVTAPAPAPVITDR